MISIDRFLGIFYNWIDALLLLWNFLNTSISNFVDPLIISFPAFLPAAGFLKLIGVYNFTLIEFMVGAGIAIYITYAFATWILNLIT